MCTMTCFDCELTLLKSRNEASASGPEGRTMEGVAMRAPKEGCSFVMLVHTTEGQLHLETTRVKEVARSGNSILFTTKNSTYRLEIKL